MKATTQQIILQAEFLGIRPLQRYFQLKTRQIALQVEREFSQSSDLGRLPVASPSEVGQGGNL